MSDHIKYYTNVILEDICDIIRNGPSGDDIIDTYKAEMKTNIETWLTYMLKDTGPITFL